MAPFPSGSATFRRMSFIGPDSDALDRPLEPSVTS